MGGPVYQRLCGAIVTERTVLSSRETEVLELCAAGLYTSAIAKRLFISTETVRSHCSNIRQKLGARTITHAVAIAYRQGSITAEQA